MGEGAVSIAEDPPAPLTAAPAAAIMESVPRHPQTANLSDEEGSMDKDDPGSCCLGSNVENHDSSPERPRHTSPAPPRTSLT